MVWLDQLSFVFVVTVLAVQYYFSLLSNDAAKAKLFACLNQRSSFLKAVNTVVKDSSNFRSTVSQLFSKGHSNFKFIINCALNCFAKIELKHLNAPKHENPRPTACKLCKLTSKIAKTQILSTFSLLILQFFVIIIHFLLVVL